MGNRVLRVPAAHMEPGAWTAGWASGELQLAEMEWEKEREYFRMGVG
jgi:hypothetical protein